MDYYRQINRKDINDFSKIMTLDKNLLDNWEGFMRDLEVPLDVAHKYKKQNPETLNYSDLFNHALMLWLSDKAKGATIINLVNILRNCGANDVANQIQKEHDPDWEDPKKNAEPVARVRREKNPNEKPGTSKHIRKVFCELDLPDVYFKPFHKLPRLPETLKRPAQSRKYNTNEFYDVTGKRKGIAVILNDEVNKRPGAEVDTYHFEKFFRAAGYIPLIFSEFYSDEETNEDNAKKAAFKLSNIILMIKAQIENTKDIKSLVFFIGAHGYNDQIVTSDIIIEDNEQIDKSVHLFKDIIYEFSNNKCPALKGKPKVFFVQACRDIATFGEKDSASKTVDLTEDWFLFQSQMPGYPGHRCPGIGTMFGRALYKVLMENAWEKDLYEMYGMVPKEMIELIHGDEIETPSPMIQLPATNKKKFHFQLDPEQTSDSSLFPANQLPIFTLILILLCIILSGYNIKDFLSFLQ